MQSREFGDIHTARIRNDKLCASLCNGATKHRTENRMLFRCIRTDNEKSGGMLRYIVHGIGHGAGAEAGGQTGHSAAMSKTCTVIDIVRADYLTCELVHQVIFFVQAFCRGQDTDTVGPVIVPDLAQAVG